MRDLTVDLLNELFTYDRETGKLYWKSARQGVTVGKEAGALDKEGYSILRINYKRYRTHRVVFLMHKGYLPVVLDHIDGDRANNRLDNLRPASLSQNQYNRKLNKNNKSGFKGVSYNSRSKMFYASIRHQTQRIFLGSYNTPEEADAVVRAAREELHGNFANHGDQ
tara:strand:+ start:42 stop:539 length:498 start_codon:yes stop_codon:yes gene_type:complete